MLKEESHDVWLLLSATTSKIKNNKHDKNIIGVIKDVLPKIHLFKIKLPKPPGVPEPPNCKKAKRGLGNSLDKRDIIGDIIKIVKGVVNLVTCITNELNKIAESIERGIDIDLDDLIPVLNYHLDMLDAWDPAQDPSTNPDAPTPAPDPDAPNPTSDPNAPKPTSDPNAPKTTPDPSDPSATKKPCTKESTLTLTTVSCVKSPVPSVPGSTTESCTTSMSTTRGCNINGGATTTWSTATCTSKMTATSTYVGCVDVPVPTAPGSTTRSCSTTMSTISGCDITGGVTTTASTSSCSTQTAASTYITCINSPIVSGNYTSMTTSCNSQTKTISGCSVTGGITTSVSSASCSLATVSDCHQVCDVTVTTTLGSQSKRDAPKTSSCSMSCGAAITRCGATGKTSTSVATSTMTAYPRCNAQICGGGGDKCTAPLPPKPSDEGASCPIPTGLLEPLIVSVPSKNSDAPKASPRNADQAPDWSSWKNTTDWTGPSIKKRSAPSPNDPEFGGDKAKFMMETCGLKYWAIQLHMTPRSTSRNALWGKGRGGFCIADLHGCTGVMAISRKGIWVSHLWEVPSFIDGPDLQSLVFDPVIFEQQVILPVAAGGADSDIPFGKGLGDFKDNGFEKVTREGLDNNPHVFLFTPELIWTSNPFWTEADGMYSDIRHVEQIKLLSDMLGVNGIMGYDPTIVAYKPYPPPPSAHPPWVNPRGKFMAIFDPEHEIRDDGNGCKTQYSSLEVWYEDDPAGPFYRDVWPTWRNHMKTDPNAAMPAGPSNPGGPSGTKRDSCPLPAQADMNTTAGLDLFDNMWPTNSTPPDYDWDFEETPPSWVNNPSNATTTEIASIPTLYSLGQTATATGNSTMTGSVSIPTLWSIGQDPSTSSTKSDNITVPTISSASQEPSSTGSNSANGTNTERISIPTLLSIGQTSSSPQSESITIPTLLSIQDGKASSSGSDFSSTSKTTSGLNGTVSIPTFLSIGQSGSGFSSVFKTTSAFTGTVSIPTFLSIGQSGSKTTSGSESGSIPVPTLSSIERSTPMLSRTELSIPTLNSMHQSTPTLSRTEQSIPTLNSMEKPIPTLNSQTASGTVTGSGSLTTNGPGGGATGSPTPGGDWRHKPKNTKKATSLL
ncbi:hypothetical protein P280DRAFT_485489 [Massarina eburnea CBS 473.64]|uniref:Uncharacterized protein n=1 Tax=Massarina eburnea CBS 473.64 TaxID=1395130 RepID=A0A6A6RH19_9PLEO|nr:hypothetical protein P280DRAFT_485489 [Massarina eburnea CBS 473.64]